MFNQPLVRSDGTIGFFIGNDGTYSILPEVDCHLALIEDSRISHLDNVASSGDSGVLDWSIDGNEILFIEAEKNEFGQPVSSVIYSSRLQTDSHPVALFSTQDSVLSCSFTGEGDITYLSLDDDSDTPQLKLYSKAEQRHSLLRENVISYRRLSWDGTLAIISHTQEGSLKLGHLASYNLLTEEEYEVASFFLTESMEENLFILPASFLWDITPDLKYAAISLYERALISPYVDNAEEQPAIYLIKQEENCAYRVAGHGILPSFSPDGSLLSYLGPKSVEDETPVIYLYDLEMQHTSVLENSIGALTFFWIDSGTLGFTVEKEEDTYIIMKVSLPSGEVETLMPEA